MRKGLSFCLLMALGIPVNADSTDWHDVMAELKRDRSALENEEKSVRDQLKSVEEQARIQDEHVEHLKARLAALTEKTSSPASQATTPATASEITPKPAPAGNSADFQKRENELIAHSADRMLVLDGKDGSPGAAFLATQEGKIRIFVSAQWLDRNPRPTVTKMDRSPVPIGEELGCPVGIDLVCLNPAATDLAHFELAGNDEKPAVGARVVVILVDPETKRIKGIGGTIRGIGPDTVELDANLTPEMTGSPVLALDSGRVIGVVAPQIAGVADEWAIGTRHQENRNFAARIDRIKEWKNSDLGRFGNEAAYVEGINQRTRIAWLAHMLLALRLNSGGNPRESQPGMPPLWMQFTRKEGESIADYEKRKMEEKGEYERKREEDQKERDRRRQILAAVKKEANQHAANPHIARVTSWLNEPTIFHEGQLAAGDQAHRLTNIYRSILTDLKKQEPDLSAHMTWYHQQQYRIAQGNRSEGIRVIAENATRVGQ